MKAQKKILRSVVFTSFIIFGFILSTGFQAYADEWTDEQKEFWEVVKADYEHFKKGDTDRIAASRHDNATIWWSSKEKPFDKTTALYGYRNWFNYDIPTKYEIEPLAITIIRDVATVAVRYKYGGTKDFGNGRDIQTWIKQNNKWLMINSFSASCDKLPPCK